MSDTPQHESHRRPHAPPMAAQFMEFDLPADDVMGHMMEHMQAGKDSMAMCPMMKQMGGMKH